MKKYGFLSSGLAFLLGTIVIIGFIALGSQDPRNALSQFFLKPFSSFWHFGNMLNKTSLLLFASLGSLFAFKCGCFNLGGEGQIYFAGLLTGILLQNTWTEPVFQLVITGLIVFFASGLIGFISGFFKIKFNADELLTSFLISAAILPAVNYLIGNPLRDTSGNLLALPPIADEFQLKSFLPPSSLNISFIFSLIAVLFFIVFFAKTKWGYRLRLSGTAPEFSRFAGFSIYAPPLAGMGISAGLHGLTGFFAITGTWYICHLSFSSGMGWAALAIALIAKNSFFAIIPAAFLYSWIQSASDAAVMSGSLVFDTAVFLQAVVFLFISANFLPIRLIKLLSRIKGCVFKRKK